MTRPTAIGVDLVAVDRMTRALRRWPGLAERVFTSAELAASGGAGDRLAARFAAKEAVFKALGDGWPRVRYHDVEVLSPAEGAPEARLSGRAAALAARRAVALSLSHDGGLAMAGAVLFPAEPEP